MSRIVLSHNKKTTLTLNLHSFTVGDHNGVRFSTVKKSEATCANTVANSGNLDGKNPYFTTPCQIDASKADQTVQVQCIDPKNPKKKLGGKATITWYKSPNSDKQRSFGVKVSANKKIWLGTTAKEEATAPLINGKWSKSGLQGAAIIINCVNNTRAVFQDGKYN